MKVGISKGSQFPMLCPMLEEFIYEDERCAMFIDGPSTFRACRSLDMDVDYGSLRGIFADAGYLVQARYYTTILSDQSYTPLRPLIDWLSYNGFVVVTRTVKGSNSAEELWQSDRDVGLELAVDAIEMSPKLDHVILLTSNGDFLRLVQLLQRRTVRTTVVGTTHGPSSMMIDELRRQADAFVDLRALIPFVSKEKRQSPELRKAG